MLCASIAHKAEVGKRALVKMEDPKQLIKGGFWICLGVYLGCLLFAEVSGCPGLACSVVGFAFPL